VIKRQINLRRSYAVSEHRVVPLAGQCLGVGIDQQLVRMNRRPLPGSEIPWTPISVKLTRTQVRHVHVPNLVRLLEHGNPCGLVPGVGALEEAELHTARTGGIERQVDALPIPGGAKRVGLTRTYAR
jgi:hypothetical protein